MRKCYRVVSKGQETKYFQNKVNARNHALNLKQRGVQDVTIQARGSLLHNRRLRRDNDPDWTMVKLNKFAGQEEDYLSATDKQAYTEEVQRLVKMMRIREKSILAAHLVNKSGPITTRETLYDMDPEVFTERYLISILLQFLGYPVRLSHAGKGNGDMLLRFDNKCIVVESKPLDVYGFEEFALQTLRYHEANMGDGCLGCILTDGARWMLTASKGGELVRSEILNIREMQKYVLSKKPSIADAEIHAERMGRFLEMFSVDNIEKSFNVLISD